MRIPLRTADRAHLDLVEFLARRELGATRGGLRLLRFVLESLPDSDAARRVRLFGIAATLVGADLRVRYASLFRVWRRPQDQIAVVDEFVRRIAADRFESVFQMDRLRFLLFLLAAPALDVSRRSDRDRVDALIRFGTDTDDDSVAILRRLAMQSALDWNAFAPLFRRLLRPDRELRELVGTGPAARRTVNGFVLALLLDGSDLRNPEPVELLRDWVPPVPARPGEPDRADPASPSGRGRILGSI